MNVFIVNGNIFYPKYRKELHIFNRVVELYKTCVLNSVSELILHAYDNHIPFRRIVNQLRMDEPWDYFNFIVYYANIGDQQRTYELRAYDLFRVKNCVNTHLDYYGVVDDLLRKLFSNTPALNTTRESKCSVYPRIVCFGYALHN